MSEREEVQKSNYSEPLIHNDGSPSFGDFLVAFREQYGKKISAGRLRSRVAATVVAESLNQQEYSMTSGSYSMLEQSRTLPRNPRAFLSAMGKLFDLNSGEMFVLVQSYRYDRDAKIFGQAVAERFRPLGLKDAVEILERGERLPEAENPQVRQAMEALKNEIPSARKKRHASTQE